jgi:hypothetical protein
MRGAAVRAVVALAAVGLAACGAEDGFLSSEGKTPEAGDARGVFETLARDGLESLAPRLVDSLRTPEATAKLREMLVLFPQSAPTRVRLVSFIQNTTDGPGSAKTKTTSVAYELNYPDRNLTAQVVFQSVDAGARRIAGLHTSPTTVAREGANAALFRDKGPLHYVFMVAPFVVAVVTLAALIVRRWARAKPRPSASEPPSVG